ncbi:MAG TPA: c-type cytochrome [Anaerolineales bacterium]|nr:c-type cytochrome [Anaerolineales bacterium]
MKILPVLIVAAAVLLTGCNFTLASDITPPPNYVSPTPMPTLGALVPASAPDVQQGAAIYAQNCAACHGDKGLGDGAQSMQLPVTVPGIGLPEVAREASPASWFKMVTQGNLDRFMPPFAEALTDQQRWDVVAYALSLHTNAEQLSEGRQLFEANCAGCTARFLDQARMAALSEADLTNEIKNGQGDIPAFGKSLTDDQTRAVAAYLRSLTFASGPGVAAAPATTAAPGTELPAATPDAGTPAAATPAASTGTITGTVQMGDGSSMPADLAVTLHGYDHGQDQSSGPQEVLTLTGTTAPDGSYSFQNVGMPTNRIFLAEAAYDGLQYRSNFAAVTANATSLAIPALKLYQKSNDFGLLKLNQVHVYTDFATAGTVQVLEIFAFSNPSDKSVVISSDGSSIPFIKLPENAQSVGYEAGQDSAPFVSADKGLAAVPSDTPYSIIAFFTMPYDKKIEIKQPFAMDAPAIVLLIPEGLKVSSKQLTDRGLQVIQNNNYHEFSANPLKAQEELTFSISGSPSASSATGPDARQWTLIGGGSLGIILIAVGGLLYFRDRRKAPQPAESKEFDSADEVMDAILALDDLHRAGKIGAEAYQKRRQELKDMLREVA